MDLLDNEVVNSDDNLTKIVKKIQSINTGQAVDSLISEVDENTENLNKLIFKLKSINENEPTLFAQGISSNEEENVLACDKLLLYVKVLFQ